MQLQEVYETRNAIVLNIELLTGGELLVKLRENSLNESDARHIATRLLKGLDYLAQRNIIHRDIKPDNLVCARSKTIDVKIIDFGLAYQLESPQKLCFEECGTFGYIAPEVLNREGYNTKADVFSAGVVLFFLLTGSPLFFSLNQEQTYQMNKACAIDFEGAKWKNIGSDDAKDLLKTMLERDPQKRISAA